MSLCQAVGHPRVGVTIDFLAQDLAELRIDVTQCQSFAAVQIEHESVSIGGRQSSTDDMDVRPTPGSEKDDKILWVRPQLSRRTPARTVSWLVAPSASTDLFSSLRPIYSLPR